MKRADQPVDLFGSPQVFNTELSDQESFVFLLVYATRALLGSLRFLTSGYFLSSTFVVLTTLPGWGRLAGPNEFPTMASDIRIRSPLACNRDFRVADRCWQVCLSGVASFVSGAHLMRI